ncbi:MAG: hydantoinase B/oxoprolinase family protein [Nitrospinae bacterium]|nr:hydantoinase B/oxoprolinase family protein [Nitrospinota bacterium]
MQFTTQAVIERIKTSGCGPGDIFLVNDPYSGGTHLMDVKVVFGALGKAIPDRLFGTPFGTVNNVTIGGTDELRGPYVMYMFNGGGYGGSKALDGLTYGAPTISISKTQPYEVFEQRYPVIFRQFAIRENSVGFRIPYPGAYAQQGRGN